MNGFLIDTNVISELTRPAPNDNVLSFLTQNQALWVSSISVHELIFGLHLMPNGKRREDIARTISAFTVEYEDRILAVGKHEANQGALVKAQAQQAGLIVHLADALIAGTALVHDLIVVTRNVSDFQGLGVDLLNPF